MTEPEFDFEPIAEFLRGGGHPFFAAGIFDVPEQVIRNWMRCEGMPIKRIFGNTATDARNGQILQLRQQDKSMREIASVVGCTSVNVSLVLRKHGYKQRKVISQKQRDKWNQQKEARLIEAHILFLELRGEGKSYPEIKTKLGQTTYFKVMKIIKLGNPDLYDKIRKEQAKEASDKVWVDKDQIIEDRHNRGHYKNVSNRVKELWTDPNYRNRGKNNGTASD